MDERSQSDDEPIHTTERNSTCCEILANDEFGNEKASTKVSS